jgi:hypothetical protein
MDNPLTQGAVTAGVTAAAVAATAADKTDKVENLERTFQKIVCYYHCKGRESLLLGIITR